MSEETPISQFKAVIYPGEVYLKADHKLIAFNKNRLALMYRLKHEECAVWDSRGHARKQEDGKLVSDAEMKMVWHFHPRPDGNYPHTMKIHHWEMAQDTYSHKGLPWIAPGTIICTKFDRGCSVEFPAGSRFTHGSIRTSSFHMERVIWNQKNNVISLEKIRLVRDFPNPQHGRIQISHQPDKFWYPWGRKLKLENLVYVVNGEYFVKTKQETVEHQPFWFHLERRNADYAQAIVEGSGRKVFLEETLERLKRCSAPELKMLFGEFKSRGDL